MTPFDRVAIPLVFVVLIGLGWVVGWRPFSGWW